MCMCLFFQVLADIGDSQSLQQNLSTFSGHIARLKLLLGAAGQQSLVLLDEVGSGTDPLVSLGGVEGSVWGLAKPHVACAL